MSGKTLLVDIVLKDKIVLCGCAIFPEEVKPGTAGYSTVQEINDAFNKILWGKKFISFQNEYINGYVHVNNVESYAIK